MQASESQELVTIPEHCNEPLIESLATAETIAEESSNGPNQTEPAQTLLTLHHSGTTQPQKKKLIVSKVTGTVKWFNVRSGYGFIHRHDEDSDVFVHYTAITSHLSRKSECSLAEAEVVEFDIVESDKGMEAANVTGPNGTPVKGSPYAYNARNDYDKDGQLRGYRGYGEEEESSGAESQRKRAGDGYYYSTHYPPHGGGYYEGSWQRRSSTGGVFPHDYRAAHYYGRPFPGRGGYRDGGISPRSGYYGAGGEYLPDHAGAAYPPSAPSASTTSLVPPPPVSFWRGRGRPGRTEPSNDSTAASLKESNDTGTMTVEAPPMEMELRVAVYARDTEPPTSTSATNVGNGNQTARERILGGVSSGSSGGSNNISDAESKKVANVTLVKPHSRAGAALGETSDNSNKEGKSEEIRESRDNCDDSTPAAPITTVLSDEKCSLDESAECYLLLPQLRGIVLVVLALVFLMLAWLFNYPLSA